MKNEPSYANDVIKLKRLGSTYLKTPENDTYNAFCRVLEQLTANTYLLDEFSLRMLAQTFKAVRQYRSRHFEPQFVDYYDLKHQNEENIE